MTYYGGLNCVGHQQLTVSTVVVSLTMPTATRPKHAILQVLSNAVRMRDGGTDPTASAGIELVPGTLIQMMEPDFDYFAIISGMEFIREGAADGIVEAEFFS